MNLKRLFRPAAGTLIVFALSAAAFFYETENASAGSINGSEASVISAAQSTFEYEGKYYKADQQYINKLVSKLSSDDTDLTAEEASEAVSDIYANVKVGIDNGYLVETGTADIPDITASPSEASEKGESGGKSGKNSKNGKNGKDDKNGKSQSSEKGKKSNSTEKGKTGESSSSGGNKEENGENIVVITSSPKPTEGPASIDVESGMKVIDNNVDELDIAGDNFEFSESVPVTASSVKGPVMKIQLKKAAEKLKLFDQSSPDKVRKQIKRSFLLPFSEVAIVIYVILLVAMITYICVNRRFRFKKVMEQTAGALLVTLGLSLLVTGALSKYCFFTSRNFVNEVADTKYFNSVYKELHSNVDDILTAAGFEKGDLDQIIDEKQVYLAGKLSLEAEFDKERTQDFMNVQNSIYEILSHRLVDRGYLFKEKTSGKVRNLSGLIQSLYRDSLKFTYAEALKKDIRQADRNILIMVIAGAVLLIAGVIELFMTQKYYHRIARLTGFSFITTGFPGIIASLFYILFRSKRSLGLSDNIYEKFFETYVKNCAVSAAELSVCVLIVGAGLIGLCIYLKSINKINIFDRNI